MGAAASIEPEVFAQVKAEYEAKKAEGVSDEVLFESMKAFIEAKTAEPKTAASTTEAAAAEAAPVASEEPAPEVASVSAEEAKPVEDESVIGASVEAVPVVAEAVTAE